MRRETASVHPDRGWWHVEERMCIAAPEGLTAQRVPLTVALFDCDILGSVGVLAVVDHLPRPALTFYLGMR